MLTLKHRWMSGTFVVFSAIYLALSLTAKPDKAALAKYNITAGQVKALVLTIAIPYLIIWFIALVGYLRLKDYTSVIAKSPDGNAFETISKGILLLTLWLPLSAILSSFETNYYHNHPAATANLIRFDNFANLLILFAAFIIINQGAEKLLALVKRPAHQIPQRIIIVFIALSAFYVFLTLNDPARHVPTKAVSVASYYLPDWTIVLTLVIPRLIMWFLGIQAVYYIFLYRQKIKGAFYKEALDRLARGLAWVIGTTIVLRCFQSLSTQLSHLGLGAILLFIYALLALISRGYILIAKGARNLQRIEEI